MIVLATNATTNEHKLISVKYTVDGTGNGIHVDVRVSEHAKYPNTVMMITNNNEIKNSCWNEKIDPLYHKQITYNGVTLLY